jgi:F-box-like
VISRARVVFQTYLIDPDHIAFAMTEHTGTSLFLPSRNLPAEILSSIFLHCADLDGALNAINTIDTPLLLTKVCSGWRSVALLTQNLWSRLFLNINPNSTHQTTLVSTWLARSGTCPLQIYLIWQTPPFLSSHPVLDVLVEYSHHWRNMFIYIPFAAYHSLLSIRGNLPILSELSLGTDDDLISDEEDVLDLFEISPQLRSLECVNLNPDMFKFPWAHITKIPIMSVSVEDCIDILRHTERLENGSFICAARASRPPKPATALYHAGLRELAVLTSPFNETVDTRDVFRFLTLPNLRSLRICNVRSPFGSDFVTFLSKINSLESLYLRRNNLSEEELLQALEVMPSLEHLTILYPDSDPDTPYPVTDNFFNELIWRRTHNSAMMPKLGILEISIDSSMGWSFVQLLRARWEVDESLEVSPPISLLRKVNVTVYGELDEDLITELETLASAGMEISVERVVEDA